MQRNREGARVHIDGIVASVYETRDERAREAETEALKKAKLQRPAEVARGVWNCNDSADPIPTGFGSLDLVTNGGLRSGLTVLGAGSSLGKTTLVSQICDNMARDGHPCLFISIEQSSREIVCKSLSRLLAMRGYEGVGTWEMTTRSQRDRWAHDKTEALFDAYEDYVNNIAPNLMLMVATEQPTVGDIRNAAKMMRDRSGVFPVVFLDYLQLLAPPNERMSDKQAVDSNLGELRRLARDMAMPVVVISSINRTSYSGQIEFESFKESGGIEFSADLLIGLQPYRIAEKIAKVKGKDKQEAAARAAVEECRTAEGNHREMELRVLKNRNGHVPRQALPLTFYPASAQFVDGVVG
jgi:replicative DNA helicase